MSKQTENDTGYYRYYRIENPDTNEVDIVMPLKIEKQYSLEDECFYFKARPLTVSEHDNFKQTHIVVEKDQE